MRHIHVVAAVMIQDNRVFAARRNDAGELALRWEFPGGKLEPGEPGEEAIIREIAEELSTGITVDRHLMRVEHAYQSFSLTMDAYLCTVQRGALVLSEHVESRWLSADELWSVNWADADLPIVCEVAKLLRLDVSGLCIAEMIQRQFTAALKTLRSCIERCPAHQWHEAQGDYPFSQVVFHTIFYADYYLGRDAWPFKSQPFHEKHPEEFSSYEELDDVLPVQLHKHRFCLDYLDHVEQKMFEVLSSETLGILTGDSGIGFRNMRRAELHINNIRHIQHHAAQLGLRLQFLDGTEMSWITGESPNQRV